MTSVKKEYELFCEQQNYIPVFLKPWWMDAAAGKDNWQVLLYKEGEKTLASFVYFTKKKFIFNLITIPKHTPTTGLWIDYPSNLSPSHKLELEKKVIFFFVEKLPKKIDYFITSIHYSFKNWLPFYWKGFNQTTKYTCI